MQKLSDDGLCAVDDYEEYESETKYGTTGEHTEAESKTYVGFTHQSFEQSAIAADGSTVISIYYDRNTVTLTFDTDGGSQIEAISGVYGTSVTAPENPTKDNREFSGWSPALPSTFPSGDTTYMAVWKLLDASSSANYIKNLKKDSTVCVTGELTEDLLKEISSAIKSSSYRITLDLSDTTGLTEIPGFAFYDCTNLAGITIPKGVTIIGDTSFSNTSLTSITIPDEVTVIRNCAFKGCRNLSSVTIPDSMETLGTDVFRETSLKNIVIPDNVKEMGKFLFYGCTVLESVTIPKSVIKIGHAAFSGCENLTEVIFEDTSNWYRSTSQDSYENGNAIPSTELEDTKKIANYLKYNDTENWYKE